MSELYRTIEQLCQNKGINITQLCKQSGASRGSLTDLKMGRKQSLSTETLSKISNYFNVSVDYLLGNDTKKEPAANSDGPKSKNKISVLLRRAEKLPKEDYDRITKNFEDTIDLYLKARGLDDD